MFRRPTNTCTYVYVKLYSVTRDPWADITETSIKVCNSRVILNITNSEISFIYHKISIFIRYFNYIQVHWNTVKWLLTTMKSFYFVKIQVKCSCSKIPGILRQIFSNLQYVWAKLAPFIYIKGVNFTHTYCILTNIFCESSFFKKLFLVWAVLMTFILNYWNIHCFKFT